MELDCKPSPAWEVLCMQAYKEMAAEAGIRVKLNILPSAKFWEIWDKTTLGFTGLDASAARHHGAVARLPVPRREAGAVERDPVV